MGLCPESLPPVMVESSVDLQEVTTPTKEKSRAMAWCGHNQIDWDYFGIASVYILDAELERALEKSENISNMRIAH